MADLSTTYLGLQLKNPIIVGSSGLTDSAEKIARLEKYGAGAVVLKSIFEEEITLEYNALLKEAEESDISTEKFDYLDSHIKQDNINKYIELIEDTKRKVKIPVIASINCVSTHEWTYFANKIEEAGADALELNIFIMPFDRNASSKQNEDMYFNIIEKVKSQISIPLSIKISPWFSNAASMIQKLSETDIKGMVLFNRFHNPDIDIRTKKISSTNIFSNKTDYTLPLRWVGLMSHHVKCDLAASTGIHNSEALIKLLLTGADAVQIVSTLYNNGADYIEVMLKELKSWMETNSYKSIDEFRGILSQKKVSDQTAYERAQFMTYFGGYQQEI